MQVASFAPARPLLPKRKFNSASPSFLVPRYFQLNVAAPVGSPVYPWKLLCLRPTLRRETATQPLGSDRLPRLGLCCGTIPQQGSSETATFISFLNTALNFLFKPGPRRVRSKWHCLEQKKPVQNEHKRWREGRCTGYRQCALRGAIDLVEMSHMSWYFSAKLPVCDKDRFQALKRKP